MLKAWLCRQRNGDYMLAGLRPVLRRVGLSAERDWYLRPGDPLGLRHMCPAIAERVWRLQLQPLELTRVWTDGGRLVQEPPADPYAKYPLVQAHG